MDGQLSSARVGIKAALDAGAALVLIHPVDAVNIRPDTVEALISELASSNSPDRADAIVPAHEGMPGHPLLLSRSAAEKVLQTDAPHLEAVVAKLRVLRIEVSDPAVALNLNTPDDYRRAFGKKPRTARRRARAKSKRG
jgi:molybdenum cofactor cytidylyltransferase